MVSQSPDAKPALGWVSSLFFLTPNRADYVVPANQMFSNFLFLVLYSLSYETFLPSASFCSSSNVDCPFHEALNKVDLYFFHSFLTLISRSFLVGTFISLPTMYFINISFSNLFCLIFFIITVLNCTFFHLLHDS